MALNLNALHEITRIDRHDIPYFRELFGRIVDTAPVLAATGRANMSVAQLMQRKLDVRNASKDVQSAWMDNYFHTSDLIAQRGDELNVVLPTYADGSVSVVGKSYLNLLNPKEQLVNGAVNLAVDDRWDMLRGYGHGEGVFSFSIRHDLASVFNRDLTLGQAKDALLWKILLRHPDEVPKEYAIKGLHGNVIPFLFEAYRDRFAKEVGVEDCNAMGVLSSPGSENGELGAFYVCRLEDGSRLLGRYDLGNFNGRLVGLAPEALRTLGSGGIVKSYTSADLKAVDEVLGTLEGAVRPDVLQPIVELRRKL